MHSQPCIFQFFLFIADFPGSALAGRKLDADDAEGDQLQRNGHSQQDQRGEKAGAGAEDDLAQAGDDVADRRDGGHGDGIGQLGGHMVHMAAMGARRGHDGGIGDGGAVVAADRAGQARRDGDDQHLALREGVADDGDQDGEGAPRSAGGKGEEDRHEEDDGGQQVLQGRRRAVQQVRDVVFCAQQVGHAGKGPCQREDQHGADHGLEALRDAEIGRAHV